MHPIKKQPLLFDPEGAAGAAGKLYVKHINADDLE
jgi:hypothetical protein